jgi:predicted nucleic acid-binding protein
MIGADTTFLVELEIQEHPAHPSARALLQKEVLDAGAPLLLAPQVVAEFIHNVTDPRRFQRPLAMSDAIEKARFWWSANEVQQVFPSDESTRLALDWLRRHQLGRKRILDTQLAATLWVAGARRVISSNPADFRLLGFEALSP